MKSKSLLVVNFGLFNHFSKNVIKFEMPKSHEKKKNLVCCNKNYKRTFGPRGPFLQRGVEVVSQLAHRLEKRLSEEAVEPFPPP